MSSFRTCGALPGSKLSVIRHQTKALHPPPPQGPNRAALPPLCVLCLIRTEEMCGHETFERSCKRPVSSSNELLQQKSTGRLLIGWLSPNDTLNFPRLTEMKRLKSFAVNVASVIMEGRVSGVAALPALQTQFGDVCQWKRAGRRRLRSQSGVNVPTSQF